MAEAKKLRASKKLRYAVNHVRPLQLIVMFQERKTMFIIMLGHLLLDKLSNSFILLSMPSATSKQNHKYSLNNVVSCGQELNTHTTKCLSYNLYRFLAIPGNDQNASPTNQKTAGSKLDRTS